MSVVVVEEPLAFVEAAELGTIGSFIVIIFGEKVFFVVRFKYFSFIFLS